MVNAKEKLKAVEAALKAALIEEASYETGEILREYAGVSPRLCDGAALDDGAVTKIDEAVSRRLNGEPLQYIFGEWEFYGLPFLCGEGVLIPRPETELLAELAIKSCKSGGRLLDLCSGTGCIPIAVNVNTGAECFAVELYPKAFSYLERNIALNNANVVAVNGDALDGGLLYGETFDVITANPPYLTAEEMSSLQREVRFEPETALFGGEDGLDFYRKLIPLWTPRLRENGLFAVETGETQGGAVCDIMRKSGLLPEIIKDYSKNDRIVAGRKIS